MYLISQWEENSIYNKGRRRKGKKQRKMTDKKKVLDNWRNTTVLDKTTYGVCKAVFILS